MPTTNMRISVWNMHRKCYINAAFVLDIGENFLLINKLKTI